MSFTQGIKFSDLTKLLEAVSTSNDIKKRHNYMKDYFDKLHKFRSDFIQKNKEVDSSLFPIIRLILSQEENERAYGLQEKSLRQLYIRALKLGKDNPDAKKITQCSEESLPNKIYEVMKTRTQAEGSLSVYEVDRTLTLLSDNQKIAFQENELRRLILQSNAVDQKWLCKMVLKRMDIKVGKTKIFGFYHPKANELFQKYNHLKNVVELIESGNADSASSEDVAVFTPIRSMLCQKVTSNSHKGFLTTKELFSETKMDGERVQVHMKDGVFRYYSRNGHEYSEGYNELITPLIKFTSVVHSIILDGEMMVYDKTTKQYRTKGETTKDVKYLKDVGSNFRSCFCAFDLMYLNGQSYLNRKYTERYQLLGQLFIDIPGVLVKTKPVRIRDKDHILQLMDIAIENNEEGIVLKEAESVYSPGDRSGGWYKVKPDYFDGVVKDFDCVIIGGYYENPYEKNFIRRYMVGVVEQMPDKSFQVYAVGEVVHGVSVQERMKINESMKPFVVDHCGESEVSFEEGKILFGRNKPHAWIPPNKSIVLECRVSELVKSREQYTEYTFRFPRINSVRRDKLWDETCTLQEFNETVLVDDGKVKKNVQRNVNKSDIFSSSRKRKGGSSKAEIIAKMTHQSQDLEDVTAIDNVLEGREFCVLTSDKNLPSIKAMQITIKKHGGSITVYPREGKTFAIIAGQLTRYVQSYISKKLHNVIRASWLVNNFGEQVLKEMPRIRPVIDLYFATDEMKELQKEHYDDFGDSYTDEVGIDELKALLDSMTEGSKVDDEKLMEVEEELSGYGLINTNFFRKSSGAFYTTQNDNFLLNSAISVFQFRTGKVLSLQDDVKTIFADKNDDLKDFKGNSKVKLVDYRWILDSNDAGEFLDQEKYFIN